VYFVVVVLLMTAVSRRGPSSGCYNGKMTAVVVVVMCMGAGVGGGKGVGSNRAREGSTLLPSALFPFYILHDSLFRS
jgi:hypothetical protein